MYTCSPSDYQATYSDYCCLEELECAMLARIIAIVSAFNCHDAKTMTHTSTRTRCLQVTGNNARTLSLLVLHPGELIAALRIARDVSREWGVLER
jgi:hypothetical protein